ncbi:MAG: zinc-dependent metalloprotease, partial [Rubrivivax sp.]
MLRSSRASSLPRLLTTLAGAFGIAGCATLAVPTGPVASAGSATAPIGAQPPAAPASAASSATGNPPARPDPAAPKPFAEVIRGAQRLDGFVPVWRKDDKVWLEIAPARVGQPMLLSLAVANSIGERGLYASQMGRDLLVEWRLVGRSVQLVARNLSHRAGADPAMARTVRQSFSDSLLAAGPTASAPHPDSRAVLVDASFLLADLQGLSTALETAFRLPYMLDRGNSQIESVRATEHTTALHTQLHFLTSRIPAPPATQPPPGATMPMPPKTLPDPRSFFIGMVLNFVGLPAQPMTPRPSDPRLGHFNESFVDLSDDLRPDQRRHYVQRWRLEKKDPAAALSAPVKPITFWLDRNIPERYRPAVAAGVLEWNKAFEKLGFKDAVVARQQPDDAEFDTLDAEHASIRWFTGADVGLARGPIATDPRSGEILDADIAMSPAFGRGARRFISEDVGPSAPQTPPPLSALALGDPAHGARCSYAAEAVQELTFALDLLEARGDLDPESPEAEAFVRAYIQDTITHEVGHTLGLKHNFRASTVITRAQLRDKGYTDQHPIAGSVMDYNPFNVPLDGEPRTELNMRSLGPYDYWAIEYAYRPLAAAEEAATLAQIAGRSREPLLAYSDDADADGFGGWSGLDPRDNRFDLGDDPLAWAEKRVALSKELWQRAQARGPRIGDDPQRLRRSLSSGFRQLQRLPDMAAKYVGGFYTERDLPGGDRPTYRPVEPAKQRAALQFLTEGFFSIDSFRFEPRFLTHLGTDYNEWERAAPVSVPTAVLALQTQAMDRLLAPGTARRLLELPYYLEPRNRPGAITLDEVYRTLQSAVWSELKAGREIDPMRRNLQREHLKRLQALLTRGVPGLPADALSLTRLHAAELQGALKRAVARPGERSV